MVNPMAQLRKESKEVVKRVESGIPGLDEVIEGGFPAGSLNLLAGKCGTGKSTFGMQFLYHGAKNENEPGLYISLEDEPAEVLDDMKRFDWDLEGLIKQKKLSIINPELTKFDSFKMLIEDEIDRIGAKRLVIEPFSLISAYFDNVYDTRRSLATLRRLIKKLGCSTLVIADIREGEQTFSPTGFEEFVVSGVIVLDVILKKDSSSFVRTAFVRKMETTNHSLKLIPMEIGEEGIAVYPDAEVF
ncbi:Circadian clock protein kinase KaiC [Candidatus Gugararchaeum adminiculabundum]|nr:Circadian clock protein kinase KaiC [Candidatus Gugararchaeum adminiculabundum]